MLNASDRERFGRIRHQSDRKRFLAVRSLQLRMRRCTDHVAHADVISMKWSFSHSGDYAAVATGTNRALGVDIQRIDSMKATPERLSNWALRRQTIVEPEMVHDRISALQAWTQCEAWAKATGTPLPTALRIAEFWQPIAQQNRIERDGVAVATIPGGPEGYVLSLAVSTSELTPVWLDLFDLHDHLPPTRHRLGVWPHL